MNATSHGGTDFSCEPSLRLLLDAEQNLMQMLADGLALEQILEALTLPLERLAPGAICTILQLDQSAAGFHIAAAPHLPPSFRQALQQVDLHTAGGSCAAAIRSREPTIVTDIAHDARWDSLRDAALGAGLRACWSVPILSSTQEALGAFAAYFQQPSTPHGYALELLQHLAFLAGRTIERKRLDDSLADSEQMFRAVFENELDAMAIIDPQDSTFVTVNLAFERSFGYKRDEAVGMKITTVSIKPARTLEMLLQLALTRQPTGVVRRWLKRKDGTVFPAECTACLLTVRGRQLVCGLMRDVTIQHHSRKVLELAAKVYETMTEGIAISDWPGPTLTANRALAAMTGYSQEELVGKSGGFFYEDKKLWHRIVAKCLKNDVPGDAEVILRRQNGTRFPALLSLHFTHQRMTDRVNLIAMYKDIGSSRRQESRMLFLSNHDVLTRLPNRFLFYKRLDQAIAAKAPDEPHFAVFFIDLDRFKNINETFGHPTGDRLLQLVADRLYECVRKTDLIARLGGDEFAVLAESVSDLEQANLLAEQIVAALALPFHIEDQELFVPGSVGVSLFPQDGRDADTLIKNADAAMYRAKDSGKNNYQFFAADMSTASVEHTMLENALRYGLERNEFVLYYQPKVDASNNRIFGMEALLRWKHPDFGIIGPTRFIPLAEEMGLIRAIGGWALQEACHQNALWQRAGYPPLVVSVNLSSIQMKDDILAAVSEALQQSGLAAEQLELELTESTVMAAPEANALLLHELRAMGVQISIDDFGTGYSSLSYLKRFPISTLKIDQSFVRDITHDPSDAAIADAIIALARSLNMNVIAEGVETDEQLHFLRQNGCNAYQGYLFSRPLPALEFEKLLSPALS